jgi:hypothetical protein
MSGNQPALIIAVEMAKELSDEASEGRVQQLPDLFLAAG